METIRLIGRGSPLSLLQIEKVKRRIESVCPGIKTKIIVAGSRGDALQDMPLHTVEGSDFFTEEIFEKLVTPEADIAVHSLKDMSSEHFFGNNLFAVMEREDARDVALFNRKVLEKIKRGESLVIGTCSPRRDEMATGFLQKALPQLNDQFKVTTQFIRGNVDTRLKKLDRGEYDGIILATAGLNRLLGSGTGAGEIKKLLKDKLLMILPLIECVPAPCQGAIVAEAHASNKKAVGILNKINDKSLLADCYAEKKEAIKYGAGCIQRFGVTTLDTKNGKFLYAAGKDSEGTEFVKWNSLPDIKFNKDRLFSSTEVMKDFFDYKWNEDTIVIDKPVVFIANYKSIRQKSEAGFLANKTIFASGTKTWFALSKKGFWVQGCADAMGFEFLLPSLQMPLLNIHVGDIAILTHDVAAERWRKKGYNAVSNYKLLPKNNESIRQSIANAGSIFWSSYAQYEFYGKYAMPDVQHLCAGGETAELLKEAGAGPVVFPTIKSFQQWRNSSFRSHSVA